MQTCSIMHSRARAGSSRLFVRGCTGSRAKRPEWTHLGRKRSARSPGFFGSLLRLVAAEGGHLQDEFLVEHILQLALLLQLANLATRAKHTHQLVSYVGPGFETGTTEVLVKYGCSKTPCLAISVRA